MTGYGRGESQSDKYELTVEIKSVNHRFRDIRFKMSSLFLSLILVPILYQGVDWMKLFFRQIVASSRLTVKPSQSGE